MKKYVVFILCLISISGLIYSSDVEAATKDDQTNVGISFVNGAGEENTTETPTLLVPEEVSPTVKLSGKLPSTGELITSIIWTFLGLSVMIIFVGAYSLKRVIVSLA